MSSPETIQSLVNFCLIQLHLIEERKKRLNKELLDCKIQEEYLTGIVESLQVDSPALGANAD